jgi:hypothetical protein
LKRVFQTGDEPFLQPEHLQWKYWTPRADFPVERSYVLESGAQIVAHCAIWPVKLKTRSMTVQAIHGIDWAANPAFPGAGMKVGQYVRRLARVGLCIGGTEATLRMVPRLGSKMDFSMTQWERPLRPLQKALAEKKDVKTPVRFARDLVWARFPASASAIASRLTTKEVGPEEIAPRRIESDTLITSERDASVNAYIQDCPVARHRFFQLRRGDVAIGHFCLSFALSDAKIADLWVESEDSADWASALSHALEQARKNSEAARMVAFSSSTILNDALKIAGFRNPIERPVYLHDAEGGLDHFSWHLQMLDCDKSFVFENHTKTVAR